VDAIFRKRTKWELTSDAFDMLLAWLNRDRECAGARLENIQCKLMKFFQCRGCDSPADLADKTVDRVAQKINEGEEIRTNIPERYFLGVAQYVLKEHWRKREKESAVGFDDLPLSQQPLVDPQESERELELSNQEEQRLECMKQCLQSFPPNDRELMTQYWQAEGGTKIKIREALAKGLNLTSNALRIRVHRLREKLQACVEDCVKQLLMRLK